MGQGGFANGDGSELRVMAEDVLQVGGAAAPVADDEDRVGAERCGLDTISESQALVSHDRLAGEAKEGERGGVWQVTRRATMTSKEAQQVAEAAGSEGVCGDGGHRWSEWRGICPRETVTGFQPALFFGSRFRLRDG